MGLYARDARLNIEFIEIFCEKKKLSKKFTNASRSFVWRGGGVHKNVFRGGS